ncbi:amidase [Roseomonas sp. GCM10028921]
MTDEADLLLAVGNHLAGLSRHQELLDEGAKLLRPAETAASYRLLARGSGSSPNPGLVEVAAGSGARIEGELYALPPGAVDRLAFFVHPPIRLGRVQLEDGTVVHGYLCDPAEAAGARDISDLGGWRAFLARLKME